jgi:hypothetical protein
MIAWVKEQLLVSDVDVTEDKGSCRFFEMSRSTLPLLADLAAR